MAKNVGSFQKRPTSGGGLIGTRLICYSLELKGEDINFREFPGTITELCPDGQYYGIFGDEDEMDRHFRAEEVGEFIAHLPTEEDDDTSSASVMLKTDHRYTDEEVVGALKAALIGAWHARKKKTEEEANNAIITIDHFNPF